MNKTKIVAFSGILTALSVVLLFLGTVISVFAYVSPIICGIVLIASLRNVNEKSAWLIYSAVSIISFILMADKECSLTYIFFFGYYPIIKPKIDRMKNKILKVFIKLIIFNSGIVISQLICFYIFGIPFDNIFGRLTVLVLLLLVNILFALYDKLIFMIDLIYMKKYYSKVKNLLR